MRKVNVNLAIMMATFLSTAVFAAAPVNDVSSSNANTEQHNPSIEKQLQDLTRLLEVRNKMQIRFQNQLDSLALEINEIKGNIELFDHKIEQIENRQRNLYQQIEKQSQANVAAPSNGDASLAGNTEKEAYQKAVDLVLINKDFDKAITAFERFVAEYPQSSYVANSQYWLGQLLYKQKKRQEARTAFLIVIEKFPTSSKRPDALYKIGIIDEYLGEIASAKSFYQKALQEYSGSSAAGLAEKRLKALQK